MTREQAVRAAIRKLSELEQTKETAEIIQGLQKLEPAQYRRKWTKTTIYEAVSLWSTVHGRYPSVKELEMYKELPGIFAVKREYGLSGREFLQRFFPEERKRERGKLRENLILKQFISEYEKLRPVSGRDYNERRSPETLTWNQAARAIGVSGWTELLLVSGVDTSCLKQRSARLRRLEDSGLPEKNGKYEIRRYK